MQRAKTWILVVFCAGPAAGAFADGEPSGPAARPFLDVTRDLVAAGVHPSNASADDVADDSAAVQAAIDRLAGTGGTVFLPPGRYRLTSVAVPPGVTLAGAGMESTIVRPAAKATALIAMTGGAVSGLTLFGTPDASRSGPHWKPGPRGVYKEGTSIGVHLLMVKGAQAGAVISNVRSLEARMDCLYVRGTRGLRVYNCVFNRAGRNVVSLVGDDEDFLFERCHFGPLWGLYLFDIEPGRGRWVRDGIIRQCVFDAEGAGGQGTDTWGRFLCFSGHARLLTRDIRVVACDFRETYVRVRGVFPGVALLWNRFDSPGAALVRIETNPTGEFVDAQIRGNTFLSGGKAAAKVIDGVTFSGRCAFAQNQPALQGRVAVGAGADERAWVEDHPTVTASPAKPAGR